LFAILIRIIILISNSDKCAGSNDGTMFLNMKLYKKIHIGDCIAMDGGYPLFINQFKEQSCRISTSLKITLLYFRPDLITFITSCTTLTFMSYTRL
jgi:hypothetical protein